MIPAGYIAKRIAKKPDWLKADQVIDIYSISGCTSENFTDYVNYWKHNGYWLFDSPEIIKQIAKDNSIDMSETMFFYYEIYEFEFDEEENKWLSFEPESSFDTNVVVPIEKHLEGYDVTTFYTGTVPECSPLSCNSIAQEVPTNKHCLLNSFDEAKRHLENGGFNNSEPGPYRIFAVYSLY